MLTGSLLSGLFYSSDYGETWNSTGTDNWEQSGCSWAVFHPTNHEVWFASSSRNSASGRSGFIGRTGGVYKTVDEGENWIKIADKDDLGGAWSIIYKIVIDPNFPNTLYVLTSKDFIKQQMQIYQIHLGVKYTMVWHI